MGHSVAGPTKTLDVITAMDLCVDIVFQLGDITPEFGQKEQLVDDYLVELGGSCSIFACQAAKLGLRAAGIGVVGQDFFGGLILDKLAQSGVNIDYIQTSSEIKTGGGVALCKNDGDRAILTYLGSIDAVSPEDIPDSLIARTRHLHVGSYYLMRTLQPHYPNLLQKAKASGVSVSLDTNWDPDETWDGGIGDVLPYVDIFLPNENEAKLITGKTTVEDAVIALSNQVPIVALKLGEKGAVAYQDGREYTASALPVTVVDTVGAGDSFDAGFLFGYLGGYDLEKCLQIGCICGSYNTTQLGGIAGQISREQLRQHIPV